MLKGIAASKGIGIGKAVVISERSELHQFAEKTIPESELENETTRFKNALAQTEKKMEAAKAKAAEILSETEAQVFEAYRLVLRDPVFISAVTEKIKNGHYCAEAAVFQAVEGIKAMFLQISMGENPCIVRTMDIGGDKKLPAMKLQQEENPFLGYRAIRICLNETELFKTQLRAILRASIYGNLKIMFPMISGLSELRAAKRILEEAKSELQQRGISFKQDIQVGIMIEVPSAAVVSDLLAKESDFFSIGTNELCQYTLAVDRINEKISHLYDPLNVGVLRLIKKVIDSAHESGIKVGMCGEMASDPANAVLLLGMGIDELSMVPAAIPYVKDAVRKASFEKAGEIAKKVMDMSSSKEVIRCVEEGLYADKDLCS